MQKRKRFSIAKAKLQTTNYKNFIVSENYDEIYKWQSLKNFQDKWNIEAEDFKTMYDNSFKNSISNNLWANRFWFPKDTMLKFIEYDQERVRNMFKNLFDETKNIENRVDNFVYNIKLFYTFLLKYIVFKYVFFKNFKFLLNLCYF